jgi:hypothetical protein
VAHQQPEWDTFRNISKMRAEGLLPNICHLTYLQTHSLPGSQKYFKENSSAPLALWNGLKSVQIHGRDSKTLAAIFNGISQLSPPPRVELLVGDMRMVDFKALFRLRKGKLQPGTELRLITKRPKDECRTSGYFRWDQDTESYWAEMEEEAAQIADKYGVSLVVSAVSLYEKITA